MNINNLKKDDCVIVKEHNYKLISVSDIQDLPLEYPLEFVNFCHQNQLRPPHITTGNGRALSVMLKYKHHYWTRETCNQFVTKFKINTNDSIQLFNKHSQWGIQTNSGLERGKLYILYPYRLSNKHNMRKRFRFDGTSAQKNEEIEHIKTTINNDYLEVPNYLWQLGHKNPGSHDNSSNNLVLQPPIQGKYRDNYIFIDTITKFPTPRKLNYMIKNHEIDFTPEQIQSYLDIFSNLIH